MNKWDQLGVDSAKRISEMSKDDSSGVGACIMRGKQIVSQGYNGPAVGLDDRQGMPREKRLARALHAELNAVLTARQTLDGCTIYVTHFPCSQCASVLVQVGIVRVVCPTPEKGFAERWAESINFAREILSEGDVTVEEY